MTDVSAGAARPRPSFLVRALRTLVRALLIAFLVGFTVGTLIRCAAERTATPSLQYLGQQDRVQSGELSGTRESARAA
jgi:hypothetical protein